jgi:hypothetical protein
MAGLLGDHVSCRCSIALPFYHESRSRRSTRSRPFLDLFLTFGLPAREAPYRWEQPVCEGREPNRPARYIADLTQHSVSIYPYRCSLEIRFGVVSASERIEGWGHSGVDSAQRTPSGPTRKSHKSVTLRSFDSFQKPRNFLITRRPGVASYASRSLRSRRLLANPSPATTYALGIERFRGLLVSGYGRGVGTMGGGARLASLTRRQREVNKTTTPPPITPTDGSISPSRSKRSNTVCKSGFHCANWNAQGLGDLA